MKRHKQGGDAFLILDADAARDLPGIETLGGKAYNLARMAALGLRVPPAFVLGTGWCHKADAVTPALWHEALAALERHDGARLDDPRRPLLLSVRSGAPVSMPGMMETLLDIGLTDETIGGLIRVTGNPGMAWDAYRRLIAGYGEIVAGIDMGCFDADLDAVRAGQDEHELDFAAFRDLAHRHLATYEREAGTPFPQDAREQLSQAIHAVYRSWDSEKARAYRARHHIDDSMGTAVTVQTMVFGNSGGLSGSGVGFTRDPRSGEPQPWIDFLFNAQGEDVVSGRRNAQGSGRLASVAPHLWQELLGVARTLETRLQDMQDFEFTIQSGRLFMLQTRTGKRTAQAAARIALDLHDEGIIDAETARHRTEGLDAEALAIGVIATDGGQSAQPVARGQTAASGVATGEIALSAERAQARHAAGAPVLLLRQDAETSDMAALDIAEGLLTSRGARTSHAAVVARQMGKICLTGCSELTIDRHAGAIRLGQLLLHEGDLLTIDGNDGAIYLGAVHSERRVPKDLLERLEALRRG